MLYRSLLGKNLPLNRLASASSLPSATPHRFGALNTAFSDQTFGETGISTGSKFVMAGSPLFVTDLSKQFDFSEIQFVLSEQVCSSALPRHIIFLDQRALRNVRRNRSWHMVPEYRSVLHFVENVCVLFLLAAISSPTLPGQVWSELERWAPPVWFQRAQPSS
jgi:hypothetical protein